MQRNLRAALWGLFVAAAVLLGWQGYETYLKARYGGTEWAVVAAVDVPAGRRLTAEMVRLIRVPRVEGVPLARSLEEVVGRISPAPLVAGQFLVPQQLLDRPLEPGEQILPSGVTWKRNERLLYLPADRQLVLGGMLRAGMEVELWVRTPKERPLDLSPSPPISATQPLSPTVDPGPPVPPEPPAGVRVSLWRRIGSYVVADLRSQGRSLGTAPAAQNVDGVLLKVPQEAVPQLLSLLDRSRGVRLLPLAEGMGGRREVRP